MTISEIKEFFTHANTHEYNCLMSVLDKMQDTEDRRAGCHVPIQLTVSILAEAIYQASILAQRKSND